jgi:hypothetical protein
VLQWNQTILKKRDFEKNNNKKQEVKTYFLGEKRLLTKCMKANDVINIKQRAFKLRQTGIVLK